MPPADCALPSRRTLLKGVAGWAMVQGLGWVAPGQAKPARPFAADTAWGLLPPTATLPGGLRMPAPLPGAAPRLPVGEPGRLSLDQGWLFHLGDIPFPEPADHNATYLSVKAGNASGAAALDFDASDWQSVTLPHDWASAQPFDRTANVSQGYRARGIGWYRRLVRLDPALEGQKLELRFDGIASHATVWVNGSEVAHSWSGYTGVTIDLTPFARYGDDLNWIAVRADATVREGWWYEGAGIYRHAWLVVRPPLHIAADGVHGHPVQAADGTWQVPITVTLGNLADAPAGARVRAMVRDAQGRLLCQGTASAQVAGLDQAEASMVLTPRGAPALWSPDDPVLHDLVVELEREGPATGQVIDRRTVAIGFRQIRFDPARGMVLNGVATKIKGVCLHQDHAGVGVAVPDSVVLWRLQRLKQLGCNAIRMTHGACSAEVMDWCDRLGFLVMAENRLFNPAPDYLAQLEWLVRRDRNHPCVFAWSVFNEEPMQGTHAGKEMVRRLRAAVRRLDPARPVTAAMSGGFFNPENVGQAVDLMGFNYYQGDYDRYHALHPDQPMLSSEDTSAYGTRGAFTSAPDAHVITSLDKEAAGWGATHRQSWQAIASRPFVAGGFVWTGLDYHGEPTPYAWPSVGSFFGIMDLCGFPKTAFGIRQAQWLDTAPMVWIDPHWTWPGREGQPIEIFAVTNAPALELRLNGKTVARVDKADRIMGHTFHIPYQPGRIEALALDGGRVVARMAHETTGRAVALRLTPARTALARDGADAMAITIDAIDAGGRHVPVAQHGIGLSIRGGAIIGLGNGDPNSHESEKGTQRSLFNGLAQAIVQGDAGLVPLVLEAHTPGLTPARLTLPREARAAPPAVAAEAPRQRVERWLRSPRLPARPDATLAPAAGDNNSWDTVGTPAMESGPAGWRSYRTTITPWRAVAAHGGQLRFAGLAGAAEIWLDGTLLARKTDPAPAALAVTVPPGNKPRELVVLIQAETGRPAGLTGSVDLAP
ncbi:beta-galactosidase GalA [Novosphingobium rhizosphaerae]|uniref:beta-galactosidase GalA n=1 Tax=Novosphingobium rhizosphaerae TaxID=1551649 RepID=UPI0017E775AC